MKRDPWLTERLGRAAWKVERNDLGDSLAELRTASPVFAYAKVPVGDLESVWRLSGHGFQVVDVAVTFERPGQIAPADTDARFAIADDRDSVCEIAGTVFRYSRFHLDPAISKETANTIKSEWVNNYFAGARGDGMVVAERDGRPVGFLLLLWSTDDLLVIDLIGVDSQYQGQGIGRDMIRFASHYGTGDGRRPSRMRVGTQIANTSSIRLYELLGFRLVEAQYVLHYHGRLGAT